VVLGVLMGELLGVLAGGVIGVAGAGVTSFEHPPRNST